MVSKGAKNEEDVLCNNSSQVEFISGATTNVPKVTPELHKDFSGAGISNI